LLLDLLKKEKLEFCCYIEYKVKDENEPRYHVFPQLNEEILNQTICINLVQEKKILDEPYFFFDALPAEIESIDVIEDTRYNGFKAYDETTNSKGDFNIDSRRFINNPRRRTEAWFPFYHEVNNLYLSINQIFRLDQSNRDCLSTNHSFIHILKYNYIAPIQLS
jgi:hypothetical protein